MRAYKFKSAQQADHIFDMILNSRLYCASWDSLNDPVEGNFYIVSGKADPTEAVEKKMAEVRTAMRSLRVCSLASTFDCHLMWAHYANGFNGVCIELDLPDDAPSVSRLSYRGVFAGYAYGGDHDPLDVAKSIMMSKYEAWQYEKEIRILQEVEFYPLPNGVRRVIVGHRVNRAFFDAVQVICEKFGVAFAKVGIGDEGIDADYVEPFETRQRRRPSA